MLVFEFKTYGKPNRFVAIDDAIRTCQFVRNKSLRYWIDNPKARKYDLNKQCAILAREFPFANELNSTGRIHLKISRQRKDHAVKLARCVITSNDVVVYEDLRVRNMVKNHCLAKSISDAGWYQFRVWLEAFGKVFGRITIAVNPAYTSQECSSCGVVVKKSLSTRTHACRCGCVLDRDHNAALNILTKGINTTGHVGISVRPARQVPELVQAKLSQVDTVNASGESTSILAGANLLG